MDPTEKLRLDGEDSAPDEMIIWPILRLSEISKSQLTKLSEEFEPKRQELELAELAESYKSFKSFNASGKIWVKVVKFFLVLLIFDSNRLLEFRLQLTNSREERRKTLSAMKAAVEYSGQITAIRAEFLEKKKVWPTYCAEYERIDLHRLSRSFNFHFHLATEAGGRWISAQW